MKGTKPISAAERNRAVRRLRSITVGTSLAALAASGMFAGIAAASWSGNQAADVRTTDTSGTTGTGTTTSTTTSSDTTTTTSATAQPTATPTIRPAATPATTTTAGGQVTSGGS